MALVTASRAVLISDERTTAESLAKSQMEYVKQQLYQEADVGVQPTYSELDYTGEYPTFNIGSIVLVGGVETAVEVINGVAWDSVSNQPLPPGWDKGIQKITLIICNNGADGVSLDDYILILEDFKVQR